MDARELVADGLVDVETAASFLGIRRAKLYTLLASGELPSVKIGKSRRIPRRALIEFAAARLAQGNSGRWAKAVVELGG